jgi:hypothetical protein
MKNINSRIGTHLTDEHLKDASESQWQVLNKIQQNLSSKAHIKVFVKEITE